MHLALQPPSYPGHIHASVVDYVVRQAKKSYAFRPFCIPLKDVREILQKSTSKEIPEINRIAMSAAEANLFR
jgi:hypothetical protein